MIEIMENLPEGVIGVRLSGRIEAQQYRDVLDPAIKVARAKEGKISALLVLDPSVRYTLGAEWQDTKLGLSHPNSWKRIAVVSDETHWTRLVPVLSAIMPGEFKNFRLDDIGTAKDWVAGS